MDATLLFFTFIDIIDHLCIYSHIVREHLLYRPGSFRGYREKQSVGLINEKTHEKLDNVKY